MTNRLRSLIAGLAVIVALGAYVGPTTATDADAAGCFDCRLSSGHWFCKVVNEDGGQDCIPTSGGCNLSGLCDVGGGGWHDDDPWWPYYM